MRLGESLQRASEIVRQIADIAATQCLNCGMAFKNVYGTHDRRLGGLIPPSCRYRPAGEER